MSMTFEAPADLNAETAARAAHRNRRSGIDVQELKARCGGLWADVISSLCSIDPSILDGDHHPCPKCGGTKRFNLCREGTGAAYCNDCPDGPCVAGDGIETVKWLTGWDFVRAITEIDRYLKPAAAVVVDDSTRRIRDQVYRKLQSVFKLSAEHRKQLQARGLSDAEIEGRGYWSAPPSAALGLLTAFTPAERLQFSKVVPGLFPGGSLKLAVRNAMMIPVKDAAGFIAGIQCRPDRVKPKRAKYFWLSSKDQGVSPGAPCHHADAPAGGDFRPKVIRVTEGPLKADIAAALSGIKTIAIAGVNNWQAASAAVQAAKPEFVWLALDADCETNQAVARATVDLYDDLLAKGFLVQLETWDPAHKGIDDALAAGAAVTVLPLEETGPKITKLRSVAIEGKVVERLKNYKMIPAKSDDPNKAWEAAPLTVREIASRLLKLHDGWPKACNRELFVPDGSGDVRYLKKHQQFFGWLGSESPADFTIRNGCLGKQEFFEELPHHVESYLTIERFPHFPPIEGHYYCCDAPQHGTGERLREFIEMFSFETDLDGQLYKAAIMTVFWGGPPGARPGFLFTSDGMGGGTGIGKSKAVEKLSRLCGGFIKPNTKDEEQLRTDLMSPKESHKRIILIDNKRHHLASETIESLVTSPEIDGHQMYTGYCSRPNVSLLAITANGASMSRDMSDRCVTVHLKRPAYSGTWESKVDKFLADHGSDVISDVAAEFAKPATKLTEHGRWSAWEAEVLGRLKDPEELQALIKSRAKDSDTDGDDADAIRDYIRERLKFANYSPDKSIVHIPTAIAAAWIADAIGTKLTSAAATRTVDRMHKSGSLPELKKNPSRANGRGLLWWGPEAEASEVSHDLEARLNAKKFF